MALNYMGGEWFKEGFRKLLSLEWNYFEKAWFRIQFAKNTKQFSTTPEKQSVVSQKQSVVYTSSQYKLDLKSLRDKEIEHTGLYWFTLNQELHPVFLEITGKSTKQSTLHLLTTPPKKWPWSPQDTHFLWLNANTTKNVDLDNLKNTQHFSASHTEFLQSTKDYTCYRKIWNQYKMKILFHTLLIQAISKQTSTLQKQNQWKTQICFSLI